MAGAPYGNRNNAKGRAWSDAIRKALAQYESDAHGIKRGEALSRIAQKLVAAAIDGDEYAMKEIGERLDGKATQHIESNVNIFDRLGEQDQLALLSALDALTGESAATEEGAGATH